MTEYHFDSTRIQYLVQRYKQGTISEEESKELFIVNFQIAILAVRDFSKGKTCCQWLLDDLKSEITIHLRRKFLPRYDESRGPYCQVAYCIALAECPRRFFRLGNHQGALDFDLEACDDESVYSRLMAEFERESQKLITDEEFQRACNAMTKLDYVDRIIVRARLLGCAFAEIGKIVELPESTCRVKYFRAIQMLRRAFLNDDDFDVVGVIA